MISFSSFISKNATQFPDLIEATYDLFLPDVLTEIARFEWGDLEDRATELLLGHTLYLAGQSADTVGATTRTEARADGGYVQVNDVSIGTVGNLFKEEYDRLLGIVSKPKLTPNSGQVRSGNRSTGILFR